MKKLMIAAALAAMTVGAMADETEYVGLYKFTASLKTTKEASKKSTTTFYINLGWKLEDGAPISEALVWWKDTALGTWANETKAKSDIKELIRAYTADDTANVSADCACSTLDDFMDAIGYNPALADAAKKNNTLGDYNRKDPKNGKWCSQFTVKKTLEDCYRVAGSKKINALVLSPAGCCDAPWEVYPVSKFLGWKSGRNGDSIFSYLDKHAEVSVADDTSLEFTKYFRFGDVTAAKASKVEALGKIGDDDYNTVNCFAFGGQGTRVTWDAYMLNKLSGSIIGTLEDPMCYKCCDGGAYACYFSCVNEKYSDNDPEADDVVSEDDGTVAYGTFTLTLFKYFEVTL